MEQPLLTQRKQAQVAGVNTFFTEPTAGWRPRLLETSGDLTWPKSSSFVDRQRRSRETLEEMYKGSNATHAANLNAKCNYLLINSNNWGEWCWFSDGLAMAVAVCPSGAKHTHSYQAKHHTCSISRASMLRINDMTSGYRMAFKSKSLSGQQESSVLFILSAYQIHSALNHIPVNLLIPFNQSQGL